MSLPTPPRSLLLACCLALPAASGCTSLHGLNILDSAPNDPVETAAADEQRDLLRAFAQAKESVIAATAAPQFVATTTSSPATDEATSTTNASLPERQQRSVLKVAAAPKRPGIAATQVEAVDPPAALNRESQPELLPVSPPRAQLNPLATSLQQPEAGQPSTEQRIKSIRDISLDIRPPQIFNDQRQAMPLPADEAQAALPALALAHPFTRGDLAQSGYDWQPMPEGLTFCYQPLYFEEVNVERYGRSFGMFQPVVSMASFYGRVPLLPYMVFARPARRCTYHAHWSLPGYRIPQWEPHQFVPSVTGAGAECAAIYGLILLIP